MGRAPTRLERLAGDVTARVLGAAFIALLAAGVVTQRVAGRAMPWLATNLALAAIGPLAAAALFAARRRRAGWWAAAAATLVVLPNTPYVLTDVIHFGSDRRAAIAYGLPSWVVPSAYLVVVATGVVGYAYVLARLITDMRRHHSRATTLAAVAAVNALCAAGVWLGRVPHLNSWDVAHPVLVAGALSGAVTLRAFSDMAIVFVGAGAAAFALWWLVATATDHLAPARGGSRG